MKLFNLSLLFTASLLTFSGCGGITPTPDKKIKTDTTLPVVTLTKRGIISDMNSVAFEWKRLQNPRVEGIYVYKKSLSDTEVKGIPYYDTIENRYSTHYVDNNVKPGSKYVYAFRAYAKDAQAKQSISYDVTTLPVLASVAWIHSISGMPRSAKILWRPHANPRVASYIIQRKGLSETEWENIATLKGRLHAEYIDEDLPDNKVYFYRIKVKTFDNIISTPSESVRVITKPLPKGVKNLQASKNRPKEIKISWRDTTQKDFYRYHLYRSENEKGTYQLVAKLFNNSYSDHVKKDGAVYFYKVSVVDKDGLESELSPVGVMGTSLVPPKAPLLQQAKLLGNTIVLSWKSVDDRAVAYKVKRVRKTSWFEKEQKEFTGIHAREFVDKDIQPDSSYSYRVYSIDKNGISSKGSVEVTLQTPESDKLVAKSNTQQAIEHKAEVVQPKQSSVKQTTEVVAPLENLDLNEI
jgi:fibronectin type 3 domain-containing protein